MIDAERPAPPLARPAVARLRTIGRVLVLALLAAGVAAAFLHRGAFEPAAIQSAVRASPAAPLAFLLAQVAASLLFVPRTLLVLAAGLAFGVWWGLLWAALGSVLGSIAGFLVARYVNGGLIDPEGLPRFGPMLRRAERGGWRAVAMLRLLPIPHSLTNYALGLTRVPLGGYTLGSLLGQLPMTIAYVDLGAAGEKVLSGKAGWLVPTLIGLAALAVSIVLPKLASRRRG